MFQKMEGRGTVDEFYIETCKAMVKKIWHSLASMIDRHLKVSVSVSDMALSIDAQLATSAICLRSQPSFKYRRAPAVTCRISNHHSAIVCKCTSSSALLTENHLTSMSAQPPENAGRSWLI